jgi:ATP-binding protein involved in chromosome partitioning
MLRAIRPDSPAQLRLDWTDGATTRLPYFDLRMACPCAQCVDEHTGARTLRPESVPLDVRVTGADPIGQYALRLRWSDGHQTGIYSFDLLHKLSLAS